MTTRIREDRRLRLLSAVCLELPETERTICGAHADFRVHGRIFAYFLRNHGGDGITAACFKSKLGQHVEHVKRAPQRFYLPSHIGRRGWFGVRLDQGEIDWDEIGALAAISYKLALAAGSRGTAASAGNAVTAGALVAGTPPALLDGTAPNVQRLPTRHYATEERGDSGKRLRPAVVPGAAIDIRSAGLRGRR
jgi:predicted DNA-binding protein (MmcQ/YjbR family)